MDCRYDEPGRSVRWAAKFPCPVRDDEASGEDLSSDQPMGESEVEELSCDQARTVKRGRQRKLKERSESEMVAIDDAWQTRPLHERPEPDAIAF